MVSALSRLLLIGIGTLLVLALALFGLRQLGLQRQFEAFNHPLIANKDFWVVAQGGVSGKYPFFTEPAFRAVLALDRKIVFELPLHRSADGTWFVYPSYKLADHTNGVGFPEATTWAQLEQLNAGYQYENKSKKLDFPFRKPEKKLRLLSLEQMTKLFPKTRFVLNFYDPQAIWVKEVATLINDLKISQRVVICSPFSKFIRELSKLEPLWVYGLDPASLDRAVILEGLYIETLASLPTDVITSPLVKDGVSILTKRIVKEIRRQKKRLILIVDDDTSTIPQWIIPEIGGVMTDRPGWAVKEFRSSAP